MRVGVCWLAMDLAREEHLNWKLSRVLTSEVLPTERIHLTTSFRQGAAEFYPKWMWMVPPRCRHLACYASEAANAEALGPTSVGRPQPTATLATLLEEQPAEGEETAAYLAATVSADVLVPVV